MASNIVSFKTGTAAQYAAATKDSNTLYFVTDERRIYKGTVPYSGGIYQNVQSLPATGVVNTLYVMTDGTVAYWDGTKYVYLVHSYITSITSSNKNSASLPTTAAVTAYADNLANDIDSRLDVLEGSDTTAGSVAKALKDAKDYTDALASGAVATNATNISNLSSGKADKATTLSGYGITNAYTKTETETAIAAAVAGSSHLKRTIVQTLPSFDTADKDTIYMVPSTAPGTDSAYDEYMLIESGSTYTFEKIGDSHVSLTGYATETYVNTAKQEAISTAASDATSKANAAKSYADGLITAEVARADAAYATAAEGALAKTAVQSVIEGDGNGQIKVDGTNVNVHGLGSAAYTASTAYDAAGAASTALTNANSYTDQQIQANAVVWNPIS